MLEFSILPIKKCQSFMIHNSEIYFKLSVKRKSRVGTFVCHFVALAKSSNK